jgi:hypothetical protein
MDMFFSEKKTKFLLLILLFSFACTNYKEQNLVDEYEKQGSIIVQSDAELKRVWNYWQQINDESLNDNTLNETEIESIASSIESYMQQWKKSKSDLTAFKSFVTSNSKALSEIDVPIAEVTAVADSYLQNMEDIRQNMIQYNLYLIVQFPEYENQLAEIILTLNETK